jgi:hypothetical protein
VRAQLAKGISVSTLRDVVEVMATTTFSRGSWNTVRSYGIVASRFFGLRQTYLVGRSFFAGSICRRHLLVHSFATIVFLGEFLISKKLGVHTLGGHILLSLDLLDTIGMCLVCLVVSTSVLLL